MQVSVEIKGLEKLTAVLRDYPRIAEPILQRALEAGAFEVQKRATKGNIPWRTGNLVQSFGERPVIGRLIATIAPGPTAPYAIFVHEGTKPHVIEAKNKRVLANRHTGQIFGRKVNHPGTKPNRFMPRIVEQAQGDVDKYFVAALDAITAEIARKTG